MISNIYFSWVLFVLMQQFDHSIQLDWRLDFAPNKQFENSPLLAMSSLKWEDMSACQSCPLTACGINLGTFAHPPPPPPDNIARPKNRNWRIFQCKKNITHVLQCTVPIQLLSNIFRPINQQNGVNKTTRYWYHMFCIFLSFLNFNC